MRDRPREYVAYYCEENIWRLLTGAGAGSGPTVDADDTAAWAVLVFGSGPSFPMFRQRAGRRGDGLVFWDYHAFALASTEEGAAVLDFDTQLGWGIPASAYLAASFAAAATEAAGPLFRILQGGEYARRLYSDRSHMRAPDGSWLAPPPPWPHPGIGLPEGDRWPLARLVDPGRTGPGELLDLAGFRSFVGALDSNRSLPCRFPPDPL
jgi:hypothetical protein